MNVYTLCVHILVHVYTHPEKVSGEGATGTNLGGKRDDVHVPAVQLNMCVAYMHVHIFLTHICLRLLRVCPEHCVHILFQMYNQYVHAPVHTNVYTLCVHILDHVYAHSDKVVEGATETKESEDCEDNDVDNEEVGVGVYPCIVYTFLCICTHYLVLCTDALCTHSCAYPGRRQ